MGRRINARIDEDLAHKLDQLVDVTKQKVTEVVKAALEMYYQAVVDKELSSAELLRSSGFIGCGEDSPDLSENYKDELSESLVVKV
ncbi:MAG: CopG family transcriptional regulator [Proteobacteria bacterium]|jgi:hypothetical protein|nr:CopG family transcriptional regulator [Pseudomonadota bacterium]